jgi:DHA1 family L-arabinose/isopropyl-beta-D-thiogalactopyranoside export protein-like MFS transporter
MKTKMTSKERLPLIGMTVSAFIFNTSEFMPIGLLTDIAKSFSISEAKAGMLITVYSWIVMLLSLPLMLLVSKIDYKKLFMGTVALFGICQVLTVLSNSYGMLMASRIGVACAHAIFWSIASPIAVRMASEEHQSKALSMVVTGTSVATIAGLPLGTLCRMENRLFDRGNHHIRCFDIYGISVPEDGVRRTVPCEAAARTI